MIPKRADLDLLRLVTFQWIIAAVWLAGVFTAMPILVMSGLVMPETSAWHRQDERYICTEVWQDRSQQSQYTTVLLFLQYCFPLAVLVFTYGRIGVEIWGKKTPGEAHQHRDLRLARSKRKVFSIKRLFIFPFTLNKPLVNCVLSSFQEKFIRLSSAFKMLNYPLKSMNQTVGEPT